MAAIVMFSRVTAIEAKRDGIRVNVITPSLIAGTPTAESVLRDGFSKKLFEKAASLAHLGVAEPDDLASLVVFLARRIEALRAQWTPAVRQRFAEINAGTGTDDPSTSGPSSTV
jgi:NAD(P)-dependent dehydrogenase (short-subunit alcohol dehydrogenase family)